MKSSSVAKHNSAVPPWETRNSYWQ